PGLFVPEPPTGRRLRRRHYRVVAVLAIEFAHAVRAPVAIRRARALAEALTVDCERMPVETLATEIQSDVQHSWASLLDDPPKSLRRAGSPSSSDSFRSSS